MLGLRAPQTSLLENTSSMECLLAGSEANVAIGISRLGMKASFIGKVPDNPLANNIVSLIKGQGVNTDDIIRSKKGRLGIMYIETGAPPRSNRIIYDRKNSAASTMSPEEINWTIFKPGCHLHITGITPALGNTCLACAARAIETAKQARMSVSFDVNYRFSLWRPQKAGKVLNTLLKQADFLFISAEEADILFHIRGEGNEVLKILKTRFQNKIVVLKQGQDGAILYDGEKIIPSYTYPLKVVNRQGAGDAFVSGALFGILNGNIHMAMEYASAMAALKMTIPHVNYPLINKNEIEELIKEKSVKAARRPLSYEGVSYQIRR